MELFKNKNPEKIVHLKNASAKLRENENYVIAVVKKFGLAELEHVSFELIKNAKFLLKLVKEVPQAVAIIPEEVDCKYKEGDKEIEVKELGANLAFLAYMRDDEVYKYMHPEHALRAREFEEEGLNVMFMFGGEPYKYFYSGDKDENVAKLDKLRPDVKELAEKLKEKDNGDSESSL